MPINNPTGEEERNVTTLIVLGAGELGGRVAQLATNDGQRVIAFTKTNQRHEALKSSGAEVELGLPVDLPEESKMLISISGTANLKAAIETIRSLKPPQRVVLTSSTGFYQGHAGLIEPTTPNGTTERAQNIAEMESMFLQWAGAAGVILRLGGLYRAGRGPLSALRKRGAPPLGPPDKRLALVHYNDAAEATYRALLVEEAHSPYIVVTQPLPTRQEFYTAACVMLGLDLPSFGRPLNQAAIDYNTDATQRDLLPEPMHPRWQEALLPR